MVKKEMLVAEKVEKVVDETKKGEKVVVEQGEKVVVGQGEKVVVEKGEKVGRPQEQ